MVEEPKVIPPPPLPKVGAGAPPPNGFDGTNDDALGFIELLSL